MSTYSKRARLSRAEQLRRYAEIAVKVGLGIQQPPPGEPGQEIVMTAPYESQSLAILIAKAAYRAGASAVTVIYQDGAAKLARINYARDEGLDIQPDWLFQGMAAAYDRGAARLAITGENPDLLSGQDPAPVARFSESEETAMEPARRRIMEFKTNWTIVADATPSWASKVFPDCSPRVAVGKLWDAIFAVTCANLDDPIAAWQAHNEKLHKRAALLNGKSYAALDFRGPGTNLTVGLADGHCWLGGSRQLESGIVCNPNVPSYEVYTMPHCQRVNGEVTSTKSLSYQGTLIEGIYVRFENGRAVEVRASRGQAVLERLIATDGGACRLGEVALVPNSSPISMLNTLFCNTLFDENAADHLAFGNAYPNSLFGGALLDPEERTRRGANRSQIHVDFMIGSGATNVDGITNSGETEAIMRDGEFVGQFA